MTKNWNEVLIEAKPLFDFLNQQTFFDKPYVGSSTSHRLIFDMAEASEYSTDDSGEKVEDWQSLLESVTPAWPDMPRQIERKIIEVLDQMPQKNYSSVSNEALLNNMQGDISRLLHCYAFGDVRQLWKDVQQVYLDGGIPCGWEGNYPEGRMLVFSVQA